MCPFYSVKYGLLLGSGALILILSTKLWKSSISWNASKSSNEESFPSFLSFACITTFRYVDYSTSSMLTPHFLLYSISYVSFLPGIPPIPVDLQTSPPSQWGNGAPVVSSNPSHVSPSYANGLTHIYSLPGSTSISWYVQINPLAQLGNGFPVLILNPLQNSPSNAGPWYSFCPDWLQRRPGRAYACILIPRVVVAKRPRTNYCIFS